MRAVHHIAAERHAQLHEAAAHGVFANPFAAPAIAAFPLREPLDIELPALTKRLLKFQDAIEGEITGLLPQLDPNIGQSVVYQVLEHVRQLKTGLQDDALVRPLAEPGYSPPAREPALPPLSLDRLQKPFRKAIEASLAKLDPGLDRKLGNLLLERKLAAEAGPRIALDLEAWRTELRVRPERFHEAWSRVRGKLPLVFVEGRVEWPDVDIGRAWAEVFRHQQSAKGYLGNAMKRLKRLIEAGPEKGQSIDDWVRSLSKALHHVRMAQDECRRRGMKVADDLADRTFVEVAKRLASDPYKVANARLARAAASLHIGEERVHQVWQNLAVRHDLAMRHGYGVLHFNALRLALLGELQPWAWPKAAEDAERLQRALERAPPDD